jgi:hypothetical protein
MEWVFAALIIAAIVYVGLILIDLTNYSVQILPRIHTMNEQAEILRETSNSEEDEANAVKDRSTAVKISVAEMTERHYELREQIRVERMRKQRLEMEYFKLRVRSRRPVTA